MKFRAHFGYDVKKASDECSIVCKDESLTVQSDAIDADINVLMKRYGVTGKLPENPRVPSYGDFTEVKDYQSALNAVIDAQDAFMEFPAQVRARFDNDPQKLLEFVSDDKNLDEARKLGLLKEKVVEQVSAVGGKGVDSKATSAAPVAA